MTALVLDGAAVVTMDAARTEHSTAYVVVRDGRVETVAAGRAPEDVRGAAGRVVDATGCLLTPGLVNTHQHLYQWATRGYAQDSTLFQWLTELYPVWAGLDEEVVRAGMGKVFEVGLAMVGSEIPSAESQNRPRRRSRETELDLNTRAGRKAVATSD